MYDFPRLFYLETSQEVSVFERCIPNGRNWSWRGTFRDGRSNEEFNNLSKMISTIKLSEKEDGWECVGGPKRRFKVG